MFWKLTDEAGAIIAALLVKASFGTGLGGGGVLMHAASAAMADTAISFPKTDAIRTAPSTLDEPQEILGPKSISAATEFAAHTNHTLFQHRLVVLLAIA